MGAAMHVVVEDDARRRVELERVKGGDVERLPLHRRRRSRNSTAWWASGGSGNNRPPRDERTHSLHKPGSENAVGPRVTRRSYLAPAPSRAAGQGGSSD